jgi:hypothetical protein
MIDADELRNQLTKRDFRRIFANLGFPLNGHSANSEGWIGKLEGPRELGEGGTGNYAVNVHHGGYRDHGDDGDGGNIFQAVQQVKGLTFPEAVEYVAKQAGIDPGSENPGEDWGIGEGQEVASYTYRFASGKYHFEQVREEPPPNLDNPKRDKQFFPRVDGTIGSPDRASKIPYRLPDFSAKREDGPDFVTYHEGEKDADNARSLGVPATTTPYGANSFTPEQVTEHFEGLHVAIFPDNDHEGESHAEDVAEALHPVAESVKIVRLDGRPPGGGDVSDWIEQKRSEELSDEQIKDELMDAIEAAEPVDPSELGDDRQSAEGEPQGDGQAGDAPETPEPKPFWYFDGEKEKVKIERAGLIQFLQDHGFGKLYAESDLDSMLVRVEDNIVRRTSRERIKDFVLNYVREKEPPLGPQVIDALLRGANVYFSDALFEFLAPVAPDFHRDTAESAFFYYRNGFVEVTADGFELRPYDELDGVIWEGQIIDREFADLTDEKPSDWEWHRHLRNVTGKERERHNALCTALGYLMHGYKDPAVTKAIIFMDEKVTDVEEGRTGKSVTTEALQYMGSTLRIDGRNFSFDSRFAFQEVTLDTAVVDFNDAKKRFPFERLFSLITDDFPVERKGKDRVTIPFKDSPKFTLSTNYVIEGKGASFDDRTFQIEFSDHYGPKHSPKDEFGHRLFDDWGRRQWAEFDNVMMACVRQYLRDGLATYDHVNVKEKKLRQETCPDFAEWIRDFIELGRRYDKKGLKNSFQEAYAPDYEGLTGYQCTRWVKTFARIYDLEVSEPKSGSTLYIVLRDTNTE